MIKKERLMELIKRNGYAEIEVDNDKIVYVCETIGGLYHSELDKWNIESQDWEWVETFEPTNDIAKVVDRIIEIYNFYK